MARRYGYHYSRQKPEQQQQKMERDITCFIKACYSTRRLFSRREESVVFVLKMMFMLLNDDYNLQTLFLYTDSLKMFYSRVDVYSFRL